MDSTLGNDSNEGSQKVIRIADKFSTFHMVAFIITAVAGREYSGWQPALSQGFGQFMIAEILLAAAFINYNLCLAEIWSAVPFSGGGYGLTRAMAGFYSGFLVGCVDVLVYVTHSAVSALFLGDKICLIAGLNSNLTLVFVLLVYILAVALSIQPSVVVIRRSFVALAVISIGILLIYLFGSLKWTDFHENASLHKSPDFSATENWFNGTFKDFMFWLPYASLPYAGVKTFTLMCAVTDTPKVTLPYSIAISLAFIFVVNMFVVFVNAAQPGGIIHTASVGMPMTVGFVRIFNVSLDVGLKIAAFLSFPAAFGKVYAYMIPSGTLLQSLGRTNLLPSFMMLNHNKDHAWGTIVTAILGFLMCLLINYRPTIDLYNICIMSTAFSNIVTSYCYIRLRLTCPNLDRKFINPLGSWSAVSSIVLFLLVFVSAAFLQPSYEALIGVAVLFAVLTVYYYGLAVKTQTMSKEEDKVFLLLHVKNFNKHKKRAANRAKGRGSVRPANFKSPERSSGGIKSESYQSEEISASIMSFGLWSQIRKFKVFGRNAVSPASGGGSFSTGAASTGGSVSVRPLSAVITPSVLPSESKVVEPEESGVGGETRGVQLV